MESHTRVGGHIVAGGIPGEPHHHPNTHVVLLGKHHADEPDHGRPVGEDPNDVGSPADLLVQPLLRVDAPMSSEIIQGRLGCEALEDDRVELASYVTYEEPHDLLAVVATLCPTGGVAASLLVVDHSDVCDHPQR